MKGKGQGSREPIGEDTGEDCATNRASPILLRIVIIADYLDTRKRVVPNCTLLALQVWFTRIVSRLELKDMTRRSVRSW